jgi:hypothetical protein
MRTHCEWPDCCLECCPFFKMWWLFDFTRRSEVARIGGHREVIRSFAPRQRLSAPSARISASVQPGGTRRATQARSAGMF